MSALLLLEERDRVSLLKFEIPELATYGEDDNMAFSVLFEFLVLCVAG